MDEAELYRVLGQLTKSRENWQQNAAFVISLLCHDSVKIRAKALWLLGEIGLAHPRSVKDAVPEIAAFLESDEPLLRERALNALGRIGRGSFSAIEAHWEALFRFASDADAKVRLSFIWASENIAVNAPDVCKNCMEVFEKLLCDADDRVRMEAPEIFRVLGKRRPDFVKPYVEKLRLLAGTDENRVVRIHCLGALRAAGLGEAVPAPLGCAEDGRQKTKGHRVS